MYLLFLLWLVYLSSRLAVIDSVTNTPNHPSSLNYWAFIVGKGAVPCEHSRCLCLGVSLAAVLWPRSCVLYLINP